jgi:hypothetical protein
MGVVESDPIILRHPGLHRTQAPVAERKRLQEVRRQAAGAEDAGGWEGRFRIVAHDC